MGTRGLTIVRLDGVERVAQYGQWDHYPEGQGCDVLKFCRKHLLSKKNREIFKEAVYQTRFISPQEYDDLWEKDTGEKMPKSGLVDYFVAKKFGTLHPEFSRNTGAGILALVLNGTTGLQNEIGFIKNSLFCEWAYCIDLDANVLEVYKGYQKSPHTKGRYAGAAQRAYYPCALVATFSLAKLPSKKNFLKAIADAVGQDNTD
ncbi:MAG: hypothetical protein WC551_08860 [Patescibacteria group bacterium]